MRVDHSLDLRGEVCPHPVLLSLEQLGRMRPGQVLEIVADCPAAFVNLPIELVRHGHRLVHEPVRRGAEMSIVVEAGGISGEPAKAVELGALPAGVKLA